MSSGNGAVATAGGLAADGLTEIPAGAGAEPGATPGAFSAAASLGQPGPVTDGSTPGTSATTMGAGSSSSTTATTPAPAPVLATTAVAPPGTCLSCEMPLRRKKSFCVEHDKMYQDLKRKARKHSEFSKEFSKAGAKEMREIMKMYEEWQR